MTGSMSTKIQPSKFRTWNAEMQYQSFSEIADKYESISVSSRTLQTQQMLHHFNYDHFI